MNRAAKITAWVLQILLGLAIAGGGMLKLTGDPTMVEMFDDIGVGQWLRLVIGTLEVAGGVGLMIPTCASTWPHSACWSCSSA